MNPVQAGFASLGVETERQGLNVDQLVVRDDVDVVVPIDIAVEPPTDRKRQQHQPRQYESAGGDSEGTTAQEVDAEPCQEQGEEQEQGR
jgi:hypothetical protein